MTRSPLHSQHELLGARFTDFGGWEMPVQYNSVLAEHRAVRSNAGVFDVTHLGRFSLEGPGARSALRSLLCNDVDRIEPGRCQYTMILNDRGGIIDDLIVWWLSEESFWVMPNAVNQARVMAAFASRDGCEVRDLQHETVFLALQGPDANAVFEAVVDTPPGRFRNQTYAFGHDEITVAGTGYTGEKGVEVCVSPGSAEELLRKLLDAGATPAGLGARDTLRLEAGFPLWGQDIDESTTPLEAGLRFAVSLDHEFQGRAVLARQSEEGVKKELTGFILRERGVPRTGYSIRSKGGSRGKVTSGNHSPMIETGIGLAYLQPAEKPGQDVEVEIRDKWVAGETARPPLHQWDADTT